MNKSEIDIIVVGGGPAGMAAAITASKSGLKTLLLERGDFCGAKNMFGGAIYTIPTLEIYPDFISQAPLERGIIKHNYALLGKKDSTIISYNNPSENFFEAYSVFRPHWDKWCAKKAEEAGVIVIPQILVESLIEQNGQFVGIKTSNEQYYARIIILADGVNSLLAKQHGLRKPISSKNVALSVKQTLSLSKEKIEDRFNLDDNTGSVYTIMGGPMLGITALGFLYTNIDTISLGVGITLEDLKKSQKKPYEYLEELKSHPTLKRLLKNSEVKEYSAHLIPEGGYKAIPQLTYNGLMICGDAASLVNNIHWEGSNLAMLSGKFAALAAIDAIKNNDLSKNSLSKYDKLLNESFIIRDMHSYRNVMKSIESNASVFLGFYPEKINSFMNVFTSVDSIPKKQKYKEFIAQTLKERNIFQIALDATKIAKLAGEAIL